MIAGYVSTLPTDVFNRLFLTDASAPVRIVENVIVGPLVAALAFVCSIGNIPLAAVLWSGGISFAGVIAFIFADLIIIPIVNVYRKYYGGAVRGAARRVMFVAMAVAALVVDGAVLAARPGAVAAAVDRVDRRAADHLELHVRPRPRLRRASSWR